MLLCAYVVIYFFYVVKFCSYSVLKFLTGLLRAAFMAW